MPKEVAFGRDVELIISRSGDVLTIYPVRPSLKDMAERLAILLRPDGIEVRDTEDIPERPGSTS